MRLLIFTLLLFTLCTPLLADTNRGEALLIDALRQKQAGSLEAAIYDLSLASADKDFQLAEYAQFEIGRIYYSQGKYALAAPQYLNFISAYPQSILLPQANLMLGKCFLNQKKYPEARQRFDQLVTDFPDAREAAEARYMAAKSYEAEKKWKESYLAYEETDLYHPLSYFGRKARLAIAALKKAHRKKLPVFKASAEALYKKGMAYFDQDDYEMAANIFNRLAREYPKSKFTWQALLMLGKAEYQSDSPAAISDLQRAAEGPSNYAGIAHYYLGFAYARKGDYDNAIVAMRKVTDRYPDSNLADGAAYWAAYYRELKGDISGALLDYYNMINEYPYSKSVPAAIWRIGRTYYWNSDFKNAATYLHMAQLYPAGEDSPRCIYFEGKALERLGNSAAATGAYEKLVQRYDHTYYAYRAQEKLSGQRSYLSDQSALNGEEFSEALDNIEKNNSAELAALMEIWEQARINEVGPESSQEARAHLAKYKALMNIGLSDYAAEEARYLVEITSDSEKESAQAKLGEMLVQSGEYSRPIRFAEKKVRSAVMAGNPGAASKKIWQLAYPKGYWKHVSQQAKQFHLDPYLVLAVIREESRFNPKAKSRSSARGLMQIMPRTGLGIAKDLDINRYRTGRLYEPPLNIEMGTYFLSSLVNNFKDNFYLALAGYNGGPNRIKRYVNSWYNGDLKLVDIDEFVENIPSRETRLYVQKVMGSYFEYKRLYDRKRG